MKSTAAKLKFKLILLLGPKSIKIYSGASISTDIDGYAK